jgi:hypothetical protein
MPPFLVRQSGVASCGGAVSYSTLVLDGYAESLSKLLKATDDNMVKYRVGDAPRIMAAIAQRISIKEKIELSISYVSCGIYSFPLRLTCSDAALGSKVRTQ